MPVPSQLGLLQNPHRIALNRTQTVPIPEPQSALHSFSIELAEALQMVIQTLVQVSPPHLLDPAKEQLAACFLSLPTTSMSSLLISMKNLNYMAANTLPLTAPGCDFNPQFNDFDIGEMIQGVGDAMSGVAAQAGVDLVLYHGDIGMKHAFVRGDESGISCTLSHVWSSL
jgi:osomolarity two-component system response regulator SSK1